MSLADEIGQFGSLVGLLLALAALLTANRANALAALRAAADFGAWEKWREVVIDAGLAVVTALVFLSGLPLAVRAVHDFHPLAEGGPLRSVFALSWLLLACLVVWQLSLAIGALKLNPPR